MSGLDTIKQHNHYALARLAGCLDADNSQSPGALFLTGVRDHLVEAVEYRMAIGDTLTDAVEALRNGDDLHEVADGAPSVYTHEIWQQFTDLGGWQEDPNDIGADPSDLTASASACLYIIADRLASALLSEIEEDDDDEDD